ncbi:MAG: Mrp/NBP35 family ATP-binding protein [Firmicutes bacterium]|jgi:Mrp family chromosome partitioning ATPase|nr:Mrp/NBP35 family ATP-binding protein [Bacillota bacterium]MDH7496773.1 Mrp/NBP35 family ATP-binding protein [Bacillota bacterium]
MSETRQDREMEGDRHPQATPQGACSPEDCGSCQEAAKGTCPLGHERTESDEPHPDKGKSAIEKLPQSQFNDIRHVVAIMSGKGGVGKSSVTALLATAFARQGYSVGVLDADITGPSIPKMFGIKKRADSFEFGLLPVQSETLKIPVMSINLLLPHEDDPVIWRGPIIANVVKQFWTDVVWGDLDYLFVDLPPGTGDAPLTVMQSLPLDGIVIVSSPQDLAVMVVKKAIKMARILKTQLLGLVENMSYVMCPHCGAKHEVFGPSRGQAVSGATDVPLLATLPLDPKLSELCDRGRVEDYESDVLMSVVDFIVKIVDHIEKLKAREAKA